MSKNQNQNQNQNGKQDLNKLFQSWEEAEKRVQAAETALAEATARRSASVKAIADKAGELGFGAGPFNRGGRVLTISTRQQYEEKEVDGKTVKVPVGEPTYYFRGPRGAAIDV